MNPEAGGVDALKRVRRRVLAAADAFPRAIGRYRICGELGRGGMGVVYDALDPTLERRVALKVMHPRLERTDPELGARFEREMRATAEIFHPNVVAILDAGVERTGAELRPYYVMERVTGESLEERLERRGRLPLDEGLAILEAIASGLAAAHARGIVHRDLKPANVLLPENGTPKVTDFGLCSIRSSQGTQDGLVGSAHYMAPEQIEGGEPEPASDLFALGGMLVRMLSGREPFEAPHLGAHLSRILRDPADGLEQLAPGVRALAARLLQKTPAERPGSALEARDAIAVLRARPRRARRLAGLSVALALFCTALGGAKLRNDLVELDASVASRWRSLEDARQAAAGTAALDELGRGAPSVHVHSSMYEALGARNRVRVAALRYNEAAAELNARLTQLPWRLVARGLEPRELTSWAGASGSTSLPREGSLGPIEDEAELLDAAEEEQLDQQIRLLHDALGIDLRIVAVRDGEESIEQRAGDYFEAYRIGASTGRGVLLYYDLAQTRMRIEVGYGLERYLPDAIAGYLIREHSSYLFDAGDPAFSLLLTIRMIEGRMVRAYYQGRFDPDEVDPEWRGRAAWGGAGASERVQIEGHSLASFVATGRGGSRSAPKTPQEVHRTYLRWLAGRKFEPDHPVFTEASRAYLRRWPMSPAYMDWLLFLERGARYELAVRGDRGLLYSTSDPYLSPHILVRGSDGWHIDVIAEVEHIPRIRGGAHFWTLRDTRAPCLEPFADMIVRIDGLYRIARGDNRRFPTYAATRDLPAATP